MGDKGLSGVIRAIITFMENLMPRGLSKVTFSVTCV